MLPATAALLSSPAYLDTLGCGLKVQISLAYGQIATPGLHVMETPTHHWVETLDRAGCDRGRDHGGARVRLANAGTSYDSAVASGE